MKKPQTTACSSCGEPIYFAKTSSGKPMPVDAEPSDQGNVLLAIDADTRQLKAEVLGRGTEPPAGRNVYLSHFVTCPHSESHRKAHRGQRPFDAPKLAITLHSPWAQCIIYGTKRVENRTWKPPAKVRGERLVIHCGKTDDKEKWAELRDSDIGYTPTEENWHAGHIIGSVKGQTLDFLWHQVLDSGELDQGTGRIFVSELDDGRRELREKLGGSDPGELLLREV
jgi:hypothetical protein